jgi:hypothetical protein
VILLGFSKPAGCHPIEPHRIFYEWQAMEEESTDTPTPEATPVAAPGAAAREQATPEGDGLDPTRYGDWEKNGRCIDF